MVAYSFNKQFAEDVISGKKVQTVRANRKRHARVGEPIQLYTAMRTKHCRKLIDVDPVCVSVQEVIISFPADESDADLIMLLDRMPVVSNDLELFAKADGFDSVRHFKDWWRTTHGKTKDSFLFKGVVIHWEEVAT